jgi:hypothetical protein
MRFSELQLGVGQRRIVEDAGAVAESSDHDIHIAIPNRGPAHVGGRLRMTREVRHVYDRITRVGYSVLRRSDKRPRYRKLRQLRGVREKHPSQGSLPH